jgi:malate synthase
MHIPYYSRFISPTLLQKLWDESEQVPQNTQLRVAKGLQEEFPHIETVDALHFVVEIYEQVKDQLKAVLEQRITDRDFIDIRTAHHNEHNLSFPYQSVSYRTVIGEKDQNERIVIGSKPDVCKQTEIQIPTFLQGNHITIFGPPDTKKMSINAMNSYHHKLSDEHPLISELVRSSGDVPRWGADNEDSKTPIMRNFLNACENLIECYEQNISFDDSRKNKQYRLKETKLAIPIKRIPGLALPDGNHLWKGDVLPLHLYDFALHLYHNWKIPQSLVFYIPKLENEEEAIYLRTVIEVAENLIKKENPQYELGSVRLFIVFENPRAIFRIKEIAEELHPYFVGGSLGWHDFLASTARLFKCDPNYRIPVKADPNIVIKHIKESHEILRDAMQPIGGVSIGGMYGTLYEDGNPQSFEVSMVGYIRDVITQMKRGLDGFWVAHPNFVRIGIALVEAWRRFEKDSSDQTLRDLISILVPNPKELSPLLNFIFGKDVDGLSNDDPMYERSVLAANIKISSVIANHDEKEVRYNIFQALQYITDWLCGNGCVALPAQLNNSDGEPIFVRIMDDLATTERSRWELWAEVNHNRVSLQKFEQFLCEEADFIRFGQQTKTKRIQVQWKGEAKRWYPIAIQLLHQLVTQKIPVEFVSELLMPFTFDCIRNSDAPFNLVQQYHPYYQNWESGNLYFHS